MSVSVSASDNVDNLTIKHFGYEEIGNIAKWGPGIRDWAILHYVIDGKGYFNGNPVEKGQGFFIESKVLHEYHPDKKEPWKYFWVIFRSDLNISEIINANENNIFNFSFLRELLAMKDRIFSYKTSIPKYFAKACFYDLLFLHSKENTLETQDIRREHIKNAKKFMETYYVNPIKISDVSRHICISERYMYNLFMEYENISPKDFLTNLRINKAKKFLLASNMKIYEIANSVGYDDPLAFTRLFSSHTGISPSGFRKNS